MKGYMKKLGTSYGSGYLIIHFGRTYPIELKTKTGNCISHELMNPVLSSASPFNV